MRIAARMFALATWAASVWPLLIGIVFGLGLKCDDSCSTQPGWENDPDAWQWYGLAALGALAFLAGGVFAVLVWLGRQWAAACALGVAAVCTLLLFGELLTSEWIEHLDRRSPGELLFLLVLVFAGPLALILMRRRPSPGS
jgi:hypothetical protein